jgi:DNA-binding FrmR family transcriptional regulator
MSHGETNQGFDDVISQLRTLTEALDDRAMSMLRESIESGASKPSVNEKTVVQARRALEKAISLLQKVN